MRKIIILIICFASSNLYSQYPVFKFDIKFFHKDDTIFKYYVYPREGMIDSLKCKDIYTKFSKKKWTTNKDANGEYVIAKFKKKRKSKWYKYNKDKLSNFDYECDRNSSIYYQSDGSKVIFWRFWFISNAKKIPPKVDTH